MVNAIDWVPRTDVERFQDGMNGAARYPAGVIPELEIVKPRPEATVQVTPLTSDEQLNGPMPAVWP
jgi:hypothetical protein